MSIRVWCIAIVTVALVGCSIQANSYTPLGEDCSAPGDEDGNGVADCADPACLDMPACQIASRPVCGNATPELGEACDDGNAVDGDGCDHNCTVTACGNGVRTDGEACDDGNLVDGDDCEADCSTPSCGNHIVDLGEACDDGNLVDGDGCEADCSTPSCGNHIVDAGEACDDGNLVDGDGCDSNCQPTGCGNGVRTAGEACDDGNNVDADGCEADCTEPSCGNHIVDLGEACDDGNTADADGCEADCSAPSCGNHVVDPGEACDDGNNIDADGCEADCTEPSCGNHIVDPGEQCDDGNAINVDGCSTVCSRETVEREPNEDGSISTGGGIFGNDFATQSADANGAFTDSVTISGSLEPVGDEDVFAFVNPSNIPRTVRFEVWDANVPIGTCDSANFDPTLSIRGADATVVAQNDDIPGELCSRVTVTFEPGQRLYAHVAEFQDDNAIPGYVLVVTYLPEQ